MKNIKLINLYSNVVVLAYMLFSVLYYYSGNSYYLPVVYLIGLICFILVYKDVYQNKDKVMFSLIVIVLFSLVNMFIYQRVFYSILNVISSLGFSLFMIKYLKINVINYVLALLIVYFFIYYIDGGNIRFFLGTKSANHISIIFMSLSAITVFLDLNIYNLIKIRTLLLVIMSYMVVLLSLGRMGILSMSLLTIGVVLYYFKNIFNPKIMLFIVIIFLFILIFQNNIMLFINSIDLIKFEKRGFESSQREFINQLYYTLLSFKSTIFGFSDEFLSRKLGISLHNSYLEIHSYIGVGIFVIGYLIFIGLKNLLKIHYTIAIIFLAVLIRSITDTVLLFSGLYAGIVFFLAVFMTPSTYSKRIK